MPGACLTNWLLVVLPTHESGCEKGSEHQPSFCSSRSVKRLVSHFHFSSTSSHNLNEKQKLLKIPENKLLMDVETRWNSTFDMIVRILEQQVPICAVLMEGPQKLKDLSLESKQVSLLEELAAIFGPFKDITVRLSGQSYATVSIIAPTMFQLLNKHTAPREGDSKFSSNVKATLHASLQERYQDPAVRKFLNTAALLDPRLRHLGFLSNDERLEITESIKDEMCRVPPTAQVPVQVKHEPQDTPNLPIPDPPLPNLPVLPNLKREGSDHPDVPYTSQSKKIKTDGDFDLDDIICCGIEIAPATTTREAAAIEFDHYIHESISVDISRSKDFNPLNWWKTNCACFPMLSNLVRKYTCVPATSTPSKSLFSTAGNLVSQKRSILKPETVDKLVFLHANY